MLYPGHRPAAETPGSSTRTEASPMAALPPPLDAEAPSPSQSAAGSVILGSRRLPAESPPRCRTGRAFRISSPYCPHPGPPPDGSNLARPEPPRTNALQALSGRTPRRAVSRTPGIAALPGFLPTHHRISTCQSNTSTPRPVTLFGRVTCVSFSHPENA